jgi:hypothetical protein
MYPDFEQLLSCLNAEGATYLVVRGYAVGEYAQPRATKDLDIFIGPDLKNAAVVWRALARFGAPVGDITPQDLAEPGSIFRIGTPPIAVDILRDIDGVDFEQAFNRRQNSTRLTRRLTWRHRSSPRTILLRTSLPLAGRKILVMSKRYVWRRKNATSLRTQGRKAEAYATISQFRPAKAPLPGGKKSRRSVSHKAT